ncbi:MAG TPA: hypothetical protein PKJ45_13065 [Rubrivivax sp.]|nr:hypothetical protein [Rubrivivax sp.]
MKPRSPFGWALIAGVVVIAAAFVPVLWQMVAQPRGVQAPGAFSLPAAPAAGRLPAPWQIERDEAGRVHAFGLLLPGSTLGDARELLGVDLQVALLASGSRPLALEAYFERYSGGGVDGKLVLATDADAATLAHWRARAGKRELISEEASRWRLDAADLAEALSTRISGLSFLPAGRIDAATLRARFGEPAEVLPGEGSVQHWLYPQRGLAIAWDEARGRALLQVTTVDTFESRLRVPLLQPSK